MRERNKRWELLAAVGGSLLICFACLFRMEQTPGVVKVEGVIFENAATNLGIGTSEDYAEVATYTDANIRSLIQGNYYIGEEIGAGNYALDMVQGERLVVELYDKAESAGKWELTPEAPLLEYLVLEEGQLLVIRGVLASLMPHDKVTYTAVSHQSGYEPLSVLASSGSYQVGKDLPAGEYDFWTYGGREITIEVTCPYMGTNAITLSGDNSMEHVHYSGVRLQEGDVITVCGENVELKIWE